MEQRIEVFISATPEDENLFQRMAGHLKVLEHQGLISLWHNRKVEVGANRSAEVESHLQSAQVIILLLSSDFLTSDYSYNYEARRALELQREKQTVIVPVLLRPFYWKSLPLGDFQVLPRNQQPITDSSWHSVDEALLTVVQEIREILRTMQPGGAPAHQSRQQPAGPLLHLHQSPRKPFSLLKVLGIALSVVLLLFLGIGGFLLQQSKIDADRANTSATPTAHSSIHPTATSTTQAEQQAMQQYIQATSGPPTISDPLNGQTSNQWTQNEDCNFKNGGYHVTGQTTTTNVASCSFSGQFQDFVFQAQMTLLKGAGGGLLFRTADSSFGYRFFRGLNNVDLAYDESELLSRSDVPEAHYNQIYLLAVLVKGNTISLYIDQTWLGTVKDVDSTHASRGSIGFLIYQPNNTTEAVFQNVKLWQL
jgi:hypothetical protein